MNEDGTSDIERLGRMQAEIDRLCARNAELEDAMRMVVSGGYDEASRVFAAEIATRTILAKTAKEGE